MLFAQTRNFKTTATQNQGKNAIILYLTHFDEKS